VPVPVDVLVAPPVPVFVEVDELARATAGLSAVKKAMVGTSGWFALQGEPFPVAMRGR
jgi:hypothetical protein